MRTVLTAIVLCSLAAPALARSEYPELMAEYEAAWPACKARTDPHTDRTPACRTLKRLAKRLEAGGYQIVPDPDNPLGLRWD
jgi:hypothetical protein